MKKITVFAMVILVAGIVVSTILKLMMPGFQQAHTKVTSDARSIKGEISIALDSWIGYFPIQSPVLKKLMRD